MKRILTLALVSFALTSCGITSTLYYWGGEQKGATTYENLAYKNYDQQTPESICKLICMYEDIVSNPGLKLPPLHPLPEYLLLSDSSQDFLPHIFPCHH